MLRDTMIRTIPVAMTATTDVWTDRFQRLRAVRNSPPDMTLKPIQITARAAIMPSRRVSTSSEGTAPRTRWNGSRRRCPMDRWGRSAAEASVIVTPRWNGLLRCPAPREWDAGQSDYQSTLDLLPAGGNGAGGNPLAECFLGDPLGIQDDVEVVLGDRL